MAKRRTLRVRNVAAVIAGVSPLLAYSGAAAAQPGSPSTEPTGPAASVPAPGYANFYGQSVDIATLYRTGEAKSCVVWPARNIADCYRTLGEGEAREHQLGFTTPGTAQIDGGFCGISSSAFSKPNFGGTSYYQNNTGKVYSIGFTAASGIADGCGGTDFLDSSGYAYGGGAVYPNSPVPNFGGFPVTQLLNF